MSMPHLEKGHGADIAVMGSAGWCIKVECFWHFSQYCTDFLASIFMVGQKYLVRNAFPARAVTPSGRRSVLHVFT